jgi:hypothetical protein
LATQNGAFTLVILNINVHDVCAAAVILILPELSVLFVAIVAAPALHVAVGAVVIVFRICP